MKASTFSVVVLMTSHNAGAFVGHPAGASVSKLHYYSASLQQHHSRQHQQRHQRRSLDSYVPTRSRIAQRRLVFRGPHVLLMSAAGGENAPEAGSSSSGREEEKTENDERTAIPSAESDNKAAADGVDDEIESAEHLQG